MILKGYIFSTLDYNPHKTSAFISVAKGSMIKQPQSTHTYLLALAQSNALAYRSLNFWSQWATFQGHFSQAAVIRAYAKG